MFAILFDMSDRIYFSFTLFACYLLLLLNSKVWWNCSFCFFDLFSISNPASVFFPLLQLEFALKICQLLRKLTDISTFLDVHVHNATSGINMRTFVTLNKIGIDKIINLKFRISKSFLTIQNLFLQYFKIKLPKL